MSTEKGQKGRGSWSCYVGCSLCAAKTSYHQHDDYKVADAEAEAEARAAGWAEMPERKERRFHGGWLCPDCARDLRALLPREPSTVERAVSLPGFWSLDWAHGTTAEEACSALLAIAPGAPPRPEHVFEAFPQGASLVLYPKTKDASDLADGLAARIKSSRCAGEPVRLVLLTGDEIELWRARDAKAAEEIKALVDEAVED